MRLPWPEAVRLRWTSQSVPSMAPSKHASPAASNAVRRGTGGGVAVPKVPAALFVAGVWPGVSVEESGRVGVFVSAGSILAAGRSAGATPDVASPTGSVPMCCRTTAVSGEGEIAVSGEPGEAVPRVGRGLGKASGRRSADAAIPSARPGSGALTMGDCSAVGGRDC